MENVTVMTAGTAKFKIENTIEDKVKLCLLPGIARHITTLDNLGFKADAIAGQFDAVKITGYNGWNWSLFLKLARSVRLDMLSLVIQNLTPDPSIFDEDIIIGRTFPTQQTVQTRIDLQQFINVNAYDRSKITIRREQPWPFDAISYMALTMPPKACIIITFLFNV